MKRRTFIQTSSAGAIILLTPATFLKAFKNESSAAPSLEDIFLNPPDSAKARTWWHWMNGSVTKEGITLDMEAMKKAGVGGFQIFDVGSGMVEGPVVYHSDEWLEMKEHAAREAERLGLIYEMHNCPGWSSSGAPWIPPELSMQYLVWSETYVTGGQTIQMQLPQPIKKHDYYMDAMVLAFPSLKGEEKSLQDRINRVTSSSGPVDKALMTSWDLSTGIDINKLQSGDPAIVQLEFSEPTDVQSLILYATAIDAPGEAEFGAPSGQASLEVSDDGISYRKLCDISVSGGSTRGGIQSPAVAEFMPVSAKYYRLISDTNGFRINHLQLTSGRVSGWTRKSGMTSGGGFPGGSESSPLEVEVPAGSIIDLDKVIDISSSMNDQGQLNWKAPEGNWTIIRFGHTATGVTNNAAPSTGQGLECDKFSKEAYEFHFDKMFVELLPSLEKLADQGMIGALVDSYEVGAQNWTASFPSQFKDYRGYDLVKYMPAMTGRVVGNADITERFLYDIRKTCTDSIADNYYKHFAEVCEEHGMVSYAEPYGAPSDELQIGSKVDIPMGEFWIRGGMGGNDRTIKLAASIAHITNNDNQVVGAEAFTGHPSNSKWLEYPFSMKAQGDWMYTSGLNQFIFHRFAHQPHPTAAPGMTMGPWGFHFDRTNTWFPKANGWLDYVAKAQNMLRNGLFVADVAFFIGEERPVRTVERANLILNLPVGYDFDTVNAETILNNMTVKGGRIVLDSGMNYRLLVLADETKISLEMLKKIESLVSQGAYVIGPKPLSSPSLESYLNNTDAEITEIADRLWEQIDGYKVTENAYGKGKIIWGKGLEQVLDELGVTPDFEYTAKNPDPMIRYIHRNLDGNDFYFVANGKRRAEDLVCTFRVNGRQPELWDAVTGTMMVAPVYELADGRVTMPLRLDSADSVFVVFRNPAPAQQINAIVKDNQVVAGTMPYETTKRGRSRYISNTFSVSFWARPEIDTYVPGSGAQERGSTINYAIYPPDRGALYGDGHATFGVTVGRNGVVVYERENTEASRVLVAARPIAGWTHVAVVYRNGIPSIYVNGEFVSTGQQSQFVVHPTLNEAYADEGAKDYEGDLGVIELSGVALDEDQVRQLYAAGIPAPEAPPAIELRPGTMNNASVVYWQEGSYTLRDSSGNSQTVEVEGIGEPMEITGPWKVSFPPGLGAPSEITMDKLASLHRHADEGVKYFSGTATYNNSFQVEEGSTGNGKRLFLDLGWVEVLAEVVLNGKEVGLFWKPPYRIDITDFVQAGNNELEVAVTNLWPNRLIGDEHLPEEYGYGTGQSYAGSDGCIHEIPEWFLTGGQKPGQRITFTTWRHYTKDDALLESGLVGPVKLRTAFVREINT